MRFLGFDFRRAAPRLRVAGTAFAEQAAVNEAAAAKGLSSGLVRTAAQVTPLTVAVRPPSPLSSTPTTTVALPNNGRQIPSDPRDSWMWSLPDKLTPKQVMVIARAALAGDTYRMFALGRLMQETWPMLRKCSHELRQPVSNTRFVVKEAPATEKGGEASPLAQEKADLVRRAMSNFCPAPFTDEKGWAGMVYDFTDALLSAMSTGELLWHPLMDWGAGKEYLPRAWAWSHPRHFSFSQAGVLTLANPGWSQLYTWPLVANTPSGGSMTFGTLLDPTRFICAQFQSGTGPVLADGYIRVLMLDWTRVMFAQEWMFVAAQNYGSPHVDFSFEPGLLQTAQGRKELDDMLALIEQGLSNRVIAHKTGTTVNMLAAASVANDPQEKLMKTADQHCMELFLGTEATTKSVPGKLGGSNENDPQSKTKRDNVQGLANWCCTSPHSFFVAAVLIKNYATPNRDGTYDPEQVAKALQERPTIEPDFTEPLTPQEKGAVVTAFANCKAPVPLDDFYSMLGTSTPQEGDKVINPSTGEIGVMGSTDEEMDVAQAAPQPPPTAGPDGRPLPPQGQGEEDDDSPLQGADKDKALAALTRTGVARRIIVTASDEELARLVPVVEAAERAGTQNGEHALLKEHLLKLARNRRGR